MTKPLVQNKPAKRGTLYLVLGLLGVVVAVLTWFGTPYISSKLKAAPAQAEAEVAPDPGNPVVIENLVVNPAGSEGMRYLIVTLSIEPVSAGDEAALRQKDARLRDLLLTTMGSYTAEWLAGVSQRDTLKTVLSGAMKEGIGLSAEPALFFSQYVLQ